ncbi:MAG TPA: S-methyl-5-thioribose-1-phosphate isomerase [Candidatus Baltobacteraceae bacterium]|nr:S-methyl-5-thioribose-1-phosphate isomerase [Candidatus Baltobacteraceae bacterium]
MSELQSVWWDGDAVAYIDQRHLPEELRSERAREVKQVVNAIASLAVRGAPCIGIFGAYGVALARRVLADDAEFYAAAEAIRTARPTAVNLAWAVDRVLAAPDEDYLAEAMTIHEEQRIVDRAIAEHGAAVMPRSGGILTHCNTGGLATGGEGTALAVIIAAYRRSGCIRAYIDETRPLLQGARLTTFELARAGVPATLIVDAAAATLLSRGEIGSVVVGADRISSNGDVANKIGTLGIAISAAHYGVPFYVAAPRSTIDFTLERGEQIVVEQRDPEEVRRIGGRRIASLLQPVFNPAFDVTPNRLITGIITEYGVLRGPFEQALDDVRRRPSLSSPRVESAGIL